MLARAVAAVAAVLAVAFLPSIAEAQQGPRDRWVLIGTRDIDPSQGSDTIDVSKARGSFKAFRVEARRAGIDLTRVRIVYGNASAHDEDRLIHLLKGERSKPIDLRAEARFADRVELTYTPDAAARDKPRLEVWALQSPEGRRAQREGEGVADARRPKADPDKPSDAKPGERTEGGDVMFGSQDVGFGIDTDVIRVGSEVGKFSRLRLRALKNDIFISGLKVSYVDGTAEDLTVGRDLKQGRRSDWMDVKPDAFIKEIQLLYRSKPNFSGQARVEVTGQYAPGWLGAGGEGRKYNDGWVLLGAQSAGMFAMKSIKSLGFDRDTIPVGANEGGFTKIRLKVRNRSITLKDIRVVYESGEDTVISRRVRVDPDQIEGPWDVKPDRRIKEIVASYRGRIVWGKGSGVPVVEIWGQH
jgi:hypothetical protein